MKPEVELLLKPKQMSTETKKEKIQLRAKQLRDERIRNHLLRRCWDRLNPPSNQNPKSKTRRTEKQNIKIRRLDRPVRESTITCYGLRLRAWILPRRDWASWACYLTCAPSALLKEGGGSQKRPARPRASTFLTHSLSIPLSLFSNFLSLLFVCLDLKPPFFLHINQIRVKYTII